MPRKVVRLSKHGSEVVAAGVDWTGVVSAGGGDDGSRVPVGVTGLVGVTGVPDVDG